jgi:hypothetical protein
MPEIEFKIPHKTIYIDIVGMPDPMLFGTTIHYYNHSDQTLYFKIFIEGVNWTSNSVALGSLTTGTNAYINLDNFSSRAKPTSATTEQLTLTLRGYTDAGYTVLFAEFTRLVTVIFIKSDDGSWITDFSNNFDDGTIQGWSGVHIATQQTPYGPPSNPVITTEVATDYVLSNPYSLKLTDKVTINIQSGATYSVYVTGKLTKQFTTANRTSYAIFNVRLSGAFSGYSVGGDKYGKLMQFLRDATMLIRLGKDADLTQTIYFTTDKWIRVVVPLPANTTLNLNIIGSVMVRQYIGGSPTYMNTFIWLDDFKIISK